MGKPLEMYVLIFLQSMVQIRARNVGFTTKILFRFFCILSLGALVAESPQEGAIDWYAACPFGFFWYGFAGRVGPFW